MKKIILFSVLIPLFLLVIFIYKTTFIWLYERYIAADSYYSHGFLVPFVTAFLIWLKRKELVNLNLQTSNWGLVLIVAGLTIHIFSLLADVFFISGFSVIILAFGLSLYFLGKEVTKKIVFPLFFLVFMIPLPLVAINAISFPMKMIATKSAVFIIKHGFHLPIKNEGFQIFFPNASLIVENPCSGLRSLISMLALGSIFAYLLKSNATKRVILFFWAIPIALFSNLIRVILLSLGVYVYGSGVTKGFFHDFTGYLVFIIAFISLFLLWRGLECRDSG